MFNFFEQSQMFAWGDEEIMGFLQGVFMVIIDCSQRKSMLV